MPGLGTSSRLSMSRSDERSEDDDGEEGALLHLFACIFFPSPRLSVKNILPLEQEEDSSFQRSLLAAQKR